MNNAVATLFDPFEVRSRKAKTRTAAMAARLMDDFLVGGFFSRLSRAAVRSCFLRSSELSGRPVRPRVSIVPAGVPRCFVRRLRLVWAILKLELSRYP